MTTASQSKALVRRFYEKELTQGDPACVPSYFSPNFVDHDPPSPSFPQGHANPRAVMAFLAAAFSDRRVEVRDLLGDGDRVVVRFTISGRHTGPFQGRAPSGADVQLKIIAILRLEDGLIAERWGCAEIVGLRPDAPR